MAEGTARREEGGREEGGREEGGREGRGAEEGSAWSHDFTLPRHDHPTLGYYDDGAAAPHRRTSVTRLNCTPLAASQSLDLRTFVTQPLAWSYSDSSDRRITVATSVTRQWQGATSSARRTPVALPPYLSHTTIGMGLPLCSAHLGRSTYGWGLHSSVVPHTWPLSAPPGATATGDLGPGPLDPSGWGLHSSGLPYTWSTSHHQGPQLLGGSDRGCWTNG